MRKLRFIVLALAIALALVGTAAANKGNFVAHLSGGQEVPSNDSLGQGQAIFQVNADGTELHYTLIAANLENITQAHIHVGPPGTNGLVVLWLYPSAPPPQLIAGRFSGVLTEGTATAANLVGPFAGQPLSVLIAALESGGAYTNVHTTQYPPGEIRGQVH